MTREASNTTTGTNYAGEGEVRNLPSTPIIEGPLGEQGMSGENNLKCHIVTRLVVRSP
jgi:hypothetical protein